MGQSECIAPTMKAQSITPIGWQVLIALRAMETSHITTKLTGMNEAQRSEESTLTDLLAIIGNDASIEGNYCGSYYWQWEQQTAQPILEKLGYEICGWFDGERDSFGPLTRICVCKKDGDIFRFIYG